MKARTGDLIAGVSGVLLFLFMFFDWYKVGGDDFEVLGQSIDAPTFGFNAWESFGLIDLILALVAIGGVVLLVIQQTQRQPALPVAASVIVAALAALGVLLILFRILNPPGDGGVDRGMGLFLGLLATAGVLYGAYRSMREEAPRADQRAVPVEDRPAPPPVAATGAAAAGAAPPPSAPPVTPASTSAPEQAPPPPVASDSASTPPEPAAPSAPPAFTSGDPTAAADPPTEAAPAPEPAPEAAPADAPTEPAPAPPPPDADTPLESPAPVHEPAATPPVDAGNPAPEAGTSAPPAETSPAESGTPDADQEIAEGRTPGGPSPTESTIFRFFDERKPEGEDEDSSGSDKPDPPGPPA